MDIYNMYKGQDISMTELKTRPDYLISYNVHTFYLFFTNQEDMIYVM